MNQERPEGLAAALLEAAAAAGIDLDVRRPAETDPTVLTSASVESDRGTFIVISGADPGLFSFWVVSRGVRVLSGVGGDLSAIAQVIDEWRSGTALREIGARWTFVNADINADERERGDLVALQWRELREDPDNDERIMPLLEAAHADPRLRALYPVVSHYRLLFSRRAAPPYEFLGLKAYRGRDGAHVVAGQDDVPLKETPSAEEAISFLASRIEESRSP
ncbi:DUF6193 family natural product biosynthesis protein [Actinomadura chibensis]|uniref:Uncharacterized protein n=1 Tax=Actinomadura chibensis TaxID=392828 RepID=A0A5D0NGV4_9ACTN|nr:DUF6193 family natural product biosynthesis protein [Actinomadura chibensis]TYB43637.1 hypothetical protein FXF69_28055 [Actinomadura chibensis]